ncbi:scabin-related ADP-ribosyltransferase [Mycobacterium sp. NPDC003449]
MSSTGVRGDVLHLRFDEGTTSVDGRRHAEVEAFVSRVVSAAESRRDAGETGLVLHAQGGGNGGMFSRGAHAIGLNRAEAALDAIRPQIERALHERDIPADFVTIADPTSRGTTLTDDISGPDDQARRRVVEIRFENQPHTDNPADDDGDGWVVDADGIPHWGRYGAAGLLLRARNSDGVPVVLLQRRAQWSDQGGTWGLPGGARSRLETPAQAALRETHEETGLQGNRFRVRTNLVTARAPGIDWTYSTVIGDAPYPLRAESSHEGSHRWVPIDTVTELPLHPGLADSWEALREHMAANPPMPPRPSPQLDPSVDPTDVHGGYAIDNPDGALIFRDDNDLLYREDTRPPEVIFAEGFAINPATRGLSKVFDFISTTRNPELGYLQPDSNQRRFRYTIDAPGGLDVNRTVCIGPSDYQQEISFPGGIRRENIASAVEILPPDGDSSAAGAESQSSAPKYGPVVRNEHFNPDLPNENAPAVLQGPIGGRPAPDDDTSSLAFGSSGTSIHFHREDEPDAWVAYMAGLADSSGEVRQAASSLSADLRGDSLRLPFREGATAVDQRQWHVEIEDFVSRVVTAAERRRDAGHSGLILHAQGGGNGGRFSRGADAIGQERAQAVIDAIRPLIERSLQQNSMPADFVTIAAPTSRGTALPEDVSGPDDQVRRMVVVRVEAFTGERPPAPLPGRTTPPATTGIRGAVSGLPSDQPTASTDHPAAHTHPPETTDDVKSESDPEPEFFDARNSFDDDAESEQEFFDARGPSDDEDDAAAPVVETTVDLESEADTEQEFFDFESEADTEQEFFDAHESFDDTSETEGQPDPQLPARIGPDLALGGSDSIEMFRSGATGDAGLQHIRQVVEREGGPSTWELHRTDLAALFSDDSIRPNAPGMLRGGRTITHTIDLGKGRELHVELRLDGASPDSTLRFKKEEKAGGEFEHASDSTVETGTSREGRITGLGGIQGSVTHANATDTAPLIGSIERQRAVAEQRADRQISGGRDEEPGSRFEGQIQAIITTRRVGRLDPAGPVRRHLSKMVSPGSEPASNIVSSERIPYSIEVFIPSREVSRDGQDESRDHVGPLPGDSAAPPSGGPPRISQTHALGGSDVVSNFWFVTDDPSHGSPRRQTVSDLVDSASMTRTFQSAFGEEARAAMHETSNWLTVEKVQANLHGMTNKQPLVLQYRTVPGATLEVHAFVEPFGTPLHTNSGQSPASGSTPNPMMRPGGETSRTEFHYGSETDSSTVRQNARTRALQLPIPGRFRGAGGTDTGEASGGFDANHTRGVSRDQSSSVQFRHRNTLKTPVPGQAWRGQVRLRFVISNRNPIAENGRRFDAVAHETLGHFDMMSEKSESTPTDDFRDKTVWAPPQRIWGDPPADTRSKGKRQRSNPISILTNRPTITRGETAMPSRGLGSMDRVTNLDVNGLRGMLDVAGSHAWGSAWKKQRSTVLNSFHLNRIRAALPAMTQHSPLVYTRPGVGKVAVTADFEQLTFRRVVETLASPSYEVSEGPAGGVTRNRQTGGQGALGGRGGDVADGSVLGEVIVGGSQAERSGDRFRDRRREAVGTKFDQRLAVFEGWIRLDVVAAGPKARAHDSGLFPVEIAIPLSELQGAREHDTVSPPSFSREQPQGFVVDRTGPAMAWTPVAHENPPEPPQHAFNEAWHPSDMVVGVERVSGLLEAMRDDLAPVLGKQLDDAIQSLSGAYGPEVLTPRLVHESGQEWSHVVPLQIGSITVKVRPVRDARSAEYVGPSEKYEIDLIAESQSLTGMSHSDVGSTIVGGRLLIPVPHGSVTIQGTRTTQRPAGPKTDRDGHVTDPASENTTGDIDRRTVFRDRNVQPYDLFRQPITFQISYEAHGLALPLTLQESYPSAPRPVRLEAVFAYPRKAPALDAAPREPGERAEEMLRLDPRQSVVAVRPHSSDDVPDERASPRTEERTAGEDLIGTHVLDSLAPQGRHVFGAAWPRVRAELAEHVNTVAVQRRLRQFGTDAAFVVDLKSVRGGKVSLSGRIDTIGTAQPDGVSEIYRGGQTNRSVGTSASKATSWQGYVQAQGDLLPGDPGTNVSLLGRVDLGSGRGIDNTRTQLAGTGLQVRQRKDALGRAATASVTAEMSRPAGFFESGGTVRATGTARIAFTIREQTTGDPGLGRLLEGNAVGRPLSNKTVVEDLSGGDGLRVSTLADLHAASWGDSSTRDDVKTVLGDGSLSASLPAMTRGPVELFRRGALSIVGRVEMQPLSFKEVRAGNHTTNSLNEVNQVVATRNIQSLESGARLLAGPHWSVPGFNGSLLAGIGGGGRVRRGESSSETAKTTSNSRYQLPYVVFAGNARITLTARDGTTSRELTAVDLGGQFLIPTDETRPVEPPAQDPSPAIVVAETIPESEEPPPPPTAPPLSADDPASDEDPAVGMATTVDRGKARATAADHEAWDREERDHDLAALEVAQEELQTYQAELDAVLADPAATPGDRSVALGNRHDAHRYLDSVREDFEHRWQPNPEAARDQRPPVKEARMAADLGGPAGSGAVGVQAGPSRRGGLGLPVADSARGRRNDVPEFTGITQVRPTGITLSAAEFAAVVDAVVPAGRAVDALDCGPLVRALVDRLYGGRVRPLKVSDDAAGVRGGAGGARDQVVAGGGWAQVNGAAGTQQLADGLPVGSTVVAMTSPLRGEIGHVVAARVTSDGPRWADPQRPTERTGAQVPPEVASAPSVWAVVIDPMGRVVDPQTWPVVQTSSGGSVSALLPPVVDGVTDRDLTGRFGAYHGHSGNTGGRQSNSDVEMTNAADDMASRPGDDDPAGIVELRVPGDGWCLLYSVVASTPPRQWNPRMYQGWAGSASEAHRQVREGLVNHQAPVSDASSPLSRAAEGLRQLVMDWVRNRAPSDLPSDVVRPFRSSPAEMNSYEDWLADASTDELRNRLSSLGIDTTHSLDWMRAEDLRALTVQARAQELSENDPAMSVVAAHRQAESDVPHLRSRRGALAGPASQRDYLRRRGVGMPVDLIVDDDDLRSVLRVERQDQPLTPDEHQRLLDTIEKWQPSTSTWADDMGEMFPGLIGHALDVRLRNRSTAGTHDVGPRNAPPVNVFHNGVDHWNASTVVEQPGPTPTVLHRSLPSRPAPIAGPSPTAFPDTVKTGCSPESSESSDLSDPDFSDEEDASSDDGDDYRDSVARPYARGTGLPVARHNWVDAPKRGRISPTDTDAQRKRARTTEPASNRSQAAPARAEAVKPTAPSVLTNELTAATVEAMLRDQKARPKVPGIQIARNYPGTLLRTKRWLAGSSWGPGTRTNLPKELSQMPDYQQHREAIADLLRELGLYDSPLPEPQAAPKPFGADDLAHALRSLIELRKTHQKIMGGQSKGKGKGRLLLILAERTGYTGNKLTELLTAEGNWRPPRETMTRLAGYEGQREELSRLFGQLGHDDLAQDMPLAAEANAPTAGVTVAKLAAALTQIAANPGISLHAVGTTMGTSRVATGKYLAPNAGGLRIDPEWFTDQPDYAEHRDRIEAALRQMGQDGQADRLPPPFAAAEFLEALRSNDTLIVDAIARMRLDPEQSPHTAGSLAGMTANALAAFTSLVGSGPSIRDQATVETHLRDTTPYLRRELAERLEEMTNLARGHHPVASRRTGMTKVTLPGAGSAPDRMHVVHRGVPTTVKPGKSTQLALLYRYNTDLVHPPRSYQDHRPRQALRWLATALKEQLEDQSEVQAYLDADEGTLYVSSNSTALNHRLETLLASGSEFEQVLEDRAATLDPRPDRHIASLRDLMRSPVVDRGDAVSKIVAALKDGRVVVPAERYTRQYRTRDGVPRAHAVDLHAERRIMRMLKSEGRAMNLDLLAGTMRACGFCAADLEFEPTRPRGPLWLSRNATFELDTDAIIDDYLRRSIGTYATRTRSDKITVEYDTDSDSDATRESTEDQPGPQTDVPMTSSQDDSSPLSSADGSRESSWAPTQG